MQQCPAGSSALLTDLGNTNSIYFGKKQSVLYAFANATIRCNQDRTRATKTKELQT